MVVVRFINNARLVSARRVLVYFKSPWHFVKSAIVGCSQIAAVDASGTLIIMWKTLYMAISCRVIVLVTAMVRRARNVDLRVKILSYWRRVHITLLKCLI